MSLSSSPIHADHLLPALLLASLAASLACNGLSPAPALTEPTRSVPTAAEPGADQAAVEAPTARAAGGVEIASGLYHRTLRRGSVTEAARYRVVVGDFVGQREAAATLDRLETLGLQVEVLHSQERYRVAVVELSDAEAAGALRDRLESEGFPAPLEVEPYGHDLTAPGGPWEIQILEADPRRMRLEVGIAADAIVGLETTRSLAQRREALAAVNGGYFRTSGTYQGDPLGVLKLEGRVLSEPDRGRGAVGLWESDGVTRAVFGRLGFEGEIVLPGGFSFPLHGINRPRGDRQAILFTPELHATTLAAPGGLEAVVRGGRVTELSSTGDAPIPRDGFVLSLGPELAARHASRIEAGTEVSVRADLVPLLPDPEGAWEEARWIVGGGPLLLLDGQRMEDLGAESISRVFALARHPRTAVGVREDGTLLLVVVDGRRPERSVGMSLPELTDLFLELGAVSALNLDGGGSTTMVIQGRVVNAPADLFGERVNGDALLVFARDE